MALYDGEDQDDGNADDEQDGQEQEQLQQQSQSGFWGAHSEAGTSGHQLGSGFQFQTGKHNVPAVSTQDLLSTSPRAQPHQGPSLLTRALRDAEAEDNQTDDSGPARMTSLPALVMSPPTLDGSERPNPDSAHRDSETNTDMGSGFSVAERPGARPYGVQASEPDLRQGGQATAVNQQRHIAFAAESSRHSADGLIGGFVLWRRTSIGGAAPLDMFSSRTSSASHQVFQPSSFSGFGGLGYGGQRSSFGFGALVQAQAHAEAERAASRRGADGGGGTSSSIQLPGGFTLPSARSSGVGGRRSSIARPGASAMSFQRPPSQGRRSTVFSGSNTADSQYGSIPGLDHSNDRDDDPRGRLPRRPTLEPSVEGDDEDERDPLLESSGSWRDVMGGQNGRRHESTRPRSAVGKVVDAITYPVRALGSLLRRSRSPSQSRSSVHSAAQGNGGAPANQRRTLSLRQRIQKTMSKENLKSMITEPITVLPAVILGLLLNLLDGVSYGMIMFPNSNPIFAHFGGDGVAMFFVTCIISQLVYSLGGSVFKAGNGSMMIEVVPFYHILVRKIVDEIADENPGAIIATTCMAFALSSVLTGLVFLLLGLLRLGVLIGFFPRHILVGCIGGVGIFLLETGFEVAGRLQSEAGFQYNLETLKYFFQSTHMVALWLIPLSLAIFLRVITAHISHPLVVPAYFVLMPAVFYAIAFPVGYSLFDLRRDGWVFDIGNAADAPFWRFYTYFDLTQTSWAALLATMPTQFALVFLSILHPPLNIPALAVSVGQDDVNTDRELTAHGWSNIIAGAHVLLPAFGFLIAGKRLQA